VRTWIDALRWALEECEADVEFRRSVPADGKMRTDLLAPLAEHLHPEQVARRLRARLVASRRPVLDGQLSELRALDELAVETPLERRPTALAELEGTTLLFEGKRVQFPEHARADLEAVFAAGGPFRASDLPGALDDEGRLVRVKRLIREGFLRRSAAGG